MHSFSCVCSELKKKKIYEQIVGDVEMDCFSSLVFQLLVTVGLLLMLCLRSWLHPLPFIKESHIVTLLVSFAAV